MQRRELVVELLAALVEAPQVARQQALDRRAVEGFGAGVFQDLDRVEEARIGLLPVDDPHPAAECPGNQPALLAHPVGVGSEDFEAGDRLGQTEKQLRRVKRRIDKAVVVFVHSDIE